MRRTFLALLAIVAVAAVPFAQDHKSEKREGNGKLVKRDISVSAFNALKASGVYELKLTQGGQEGVTIEADENLQDLFVVKNNGQQLVIEMKKHNNLNTKNKLRVHVTFKNLKALELNTVGGVSSSNALSFDDFTFSNNSVGEVDLALTARKLHLKNKSVGEVKLSGKAEEAVFVNSSVGSLDAGNLVVQTMDIDNSGIGEAQVNAEKNLKVKDSFLGKVKNKGAAKSTKKEVVNL